jgi:DNA polymerase III subunit beta
MQVTVKQETLVKGVQSTLGIVDKRGTMPILAHCLVKAGDGQISISATDLEVSYRGSLGAEVKQEGAFTVQAHTFANLLKSLPEATLTLNADNGHVTLEAGEARYKFNTISPDEFPPIPEPDDAGLVSIEPKPLLAHLRQQEKNSIVITTG